MAKTVVINGERRAATPEEEAEVDAFQATAAPAMASRMASREKAAAAADPWEELRVLADAVQSLSLGPDESKKVASLKALLEERIGGKP